MSSAPPTGRACRLETVDCPLCGSSRFRKLGIRGNREHFGADPNTEPHVVTDVVRCLQCDFIYTNPMIRGLEHLEADHYADPARYEASAGNDAARMFASRLGLIARHKEPGLLLDVGCGKGEFLEEARKRGWRVAGVEPSEGLCAYARSTYVLEIHHGTLDSTHPAAPASLDAVTLNHVLEHVDRPDALLRAIRPLLKPTGILFVEVPNCDSYLLRAADLYFRSKGLAWSSRLSPLHPPFHRFGFTEKSLRFALERAGYGPAAFETFSGRDRGYGGGRRSVAARLRDAASAALDLLGNRELLVAVTRPAP